MSGPGRLDLKVGFACNNHCLFCAQGRKREQVKAVSTVELVRRLQAGAGRGGAPRGLVLTGGEPTLHRDLLQVIAVARRLGYRPIQLQTNGRLLAYRDHLARLLEAGVDEISPALHGSTAALHDHLTLAPGSYRQTCAGIANAVALGATVVTNSVITRDNLDDLAALVARLADLGVRRAQLAFVHPVGSAAESFDQVVPRLGEVRAPLEAAAAVAKERGLALCTEAVPLCFLRGLEELAVEERIPETTVIDLAGVAFDYSRWRRGEGKAHGPPCVGCTARERCEGPWREVPERFGWGEYVPFPA